MKRVFDGRLSFIVHDDTFHIIELQDIAPELDVSRLVIEDVVGGKTVYLLFADGHILASTSGQKPIDVKNSKHGELINEYRTRIHAKRAKVHNLGHERLPSCPRSQKRTRGCQRKR